MEMVSHDMEKLLVSQQAALIAGFCLLLIGVLRRITDLTLQNATCATLRSPAPPPQTPPLPLYVQQRHPGRARSQTLLDDAE